MQRNYKYANEVLKIENKNKVFSTYVEFFVYK